MITMSLLAYVTIGLSIGWISRIAVQDEGIKMSTSLIVGAVGALLAVAISKIVGIEGAAFFAMIGAIDMLFTLNAFHENPHKLIHTEMAYHHAKIE